MTIGWRDIENTKYNAFDTIDIDMRLRTYYFILLSLVDFSWNTVPTKKS